MAGPAVAAGVVADLRVDEAGDHGDEAVDVALSARRRPPCSSVDRPRRAPASASAYDSGDGSKPGIGRWNSSSQRAGSSSAKSTNARMNIFSAARGSRGSFSASRRSSSWRLPSANIASYSACFESKYCVQRRLPDADLAGQRMQRDAGDAVVTGELPRGARRSTPPCASRRCATFVLSPIGTLPITDRKSSVAYASARARCAWIASSQAGGFSSCGLWAASGMTTSSESGDGVVEGIGAAGTEGCRSRRRARSSGRSPSHGGRRASTGTRELVAERVERLDVHVRELWRSRR